MPLGDKGSELPIHENDLEKFNDTFGTSNSNDKKLKKGIHSLNEKTSLREQELKSSEEKKSKKKKVVFKQNQSLEEEEISGKNRSFRRTYEEEKRKGGGGQRDYFFRERKPRHRRKDPGRRVEKSNKKSLTYSQIKEIIGKKLKFNKKIGDVINLKDVK